MCFTIRGTLHNRQISSYFHSHLYKDASEGRKLTEIFLIFFTCDLQYFGKILFLFQATISFQLPDVVGGSSRNRFHVISNCIECLSSAEHCRAIVIQIAKSKLGILKAKNKNVPWRSENRRTSKKVLNRNKIVIKKLIKSILLNFFIFFNFLTSLFCCPILSLEYFNNSP